MHLELLEQGKGGADDQRTADLAGVTRVLDAQLERGDFFLCASERQRHFGNFFVSIRTEAGEFCRQQLLSIDEHSCACANAQQEFFLSLRQDHPPGSTQQKWRLAIHLDAPG